MRAFIAVDIDTKVRALLDEIVSRLKKGVLFTSAMPNWVAIENIHLTLKFLGEITDSDLKLISETLNNIASDLSPINISVEKLGVFPNKKTPKVLWIGINKGKKEIMALQQRVESALANLGFEPDEREFTAHLTLARIKSLRGTTAMMDVVTSHMNMSAGECAINEITVYQSVLQKSGPIYTPIEKFQFKK